MKRNRREVVTGNSALKYTVCIFLMSRPPSLFFFFPFINEVEGVKTSVKAWLAQPQLPSLTASFLPITLHPGHAVSPEPGFRAQV